LGVFFRLLNNPYHSNQFVWIKGKADFTKIYKIGKYDYFSVICRIMFETFILINGLIIILQFTWD